MKVRNSLKSLRGRHRNNRLVRRKGRVYVINKVQRRFKAIRLGYLQHHLSDVVRMGVVTHRLLSLVLAWRVVEP